MVVFCSPPPKPVVFEQRIEGICGPAMLQGVVNVCRGSLTYSVQVASGTEAVTLRLNTGKVIPMRAVHTSLKKKFSQERMSNFEREYSW